VLGLLAMGATVAGFLAFNDWALRHAPALGMTHPLAALPPLLLVAVVLVARAWPGDSPAPRRAAAPTPAPAAKRPPILPQWDALVQRAATALAERGVALPPALLPWPPGTDLTLNRQGRSYLVCARHWRARSVDGHAVRALTHDIARRGAAGGMLLCAAGSFTPQARQLARLHGIALLGSAEPGTHRRPHAGKAPSPAAAPTGRTATPTPSPAPTAHGERRPAPPVLRPDDEFRARAKRTSFQPTVPLTPRR
jgi:hypothetical protein